MKAHYPVLDGLRGTVAILVLLSRMLEAYYPDADNPMHHGYLGVDLFYVISGFVVGYAYDDRWGKMKIKDFLKIRLIRLHPLVVLSAVVGALCYWFDPYTGGASWVNPLKFIITVLVSFTLLPTPDVRGLHETHSLNATTWSLFNMYIVSLMYALFGHRVSKTILWVIVSLSGIALIAAVMHEGTVGIGWDYRTAWMGIIRATFPFFAGLLVFRSGKLIRIPTALPVCALILAVFLSLPTSNQFMGLYELACIFILFPLVVAVAAGSQISGHWARLCSFAGAISYPIYILHYPFVGVFTMWGRSQHATGTQVLLVGSALFVFIIALSWASLKFYDEPVRAWLKRKYLAEQQGASF
jgi:peptidoglycan/LPS O-acetylase OafA/YrhL